MSAAPVLHLDRTRCDGRGLCIELLPSRMGRDDWGYPTMPAGNDLPLRAEAEAAAVDAVALCPMLALAIRPARNADLPLSSLKRAE
jgi:ferredoxin